MPMKPPTDRDKDSRDAAPGKSAIDAALEAEHAAADESDPSDLDSDELQNELAAERDRALRLQAELENVRTRTSRELVEQRRYAALDLARDLLPVVDNVDRAIDAAAQQTGKTAAGDAGSLLEGFQLVRQQLLGVLAQHQCVPIEAAGEPFDPQFHEAILQQPSDETPANHVALVTQIGYKMHDRVVRPSQVIVSSGPAAS